MKVINLLGAPGVGKSTIASGLFYKMKIQRHNVELLHEYAKDLVWAGRYDELRDQNYVTAKQFHKQYILNKKVDYLITDSPLILGILYSSVPSEYFEGLIMDLFNGFDNMNFLVKRQDDLYEERGRMQTKDEADKLYGVLLDVLEKHKIGYEAIHIDKHNTDSVVEEILAKVLCHQK